MEYFIEFATLSRLLRKQKIKINEVISLKILQQPAWCWPYSIMLLEKSADCGSDSVFRIHSRWTTDFTAFERLESFYFAETQGRVPARISLSGRCLLSTFSVSLRWTPPEPLAKFQPKIYPLLMRSSTCWIQSAIISSSTSLKLEVTSTL